MPSSITKKLILEAELETIENTIYMHETRVECGRITKDERMVSNNQEAIVKMISQRDFIKKKLVEVNAEIDKESNASIDTSSSAGVPE